MSGEASRTRILLADDQHVVRQGVRRLLEQQVDFDVVGETDNGLEVVKLTRELKPDVIVLEARMTGLDGVETIKRVKAEHAQTAVLVFTMYDEEEYVVELLRAGAAGYLLKNIHSEELVQAIRFIRAGEYIFHPTVAKSLLKRAASPRPVALDYGEHLTRREAEVLRLAAKGMSNRDIGGYLGVTERTVKGHFWNIFSKMRVGSRTEAVLEALKRHWVNLEDE